VDKFGAGHLDRSEEVEESNGLPRDNAMVARGRHNNQGSIAQQVASTDNCPSVMPSSIPVF